MTAASSHLKKLDIIQKIASRIITNSPSDAHSAPLQTLLGLEPLDTRRRRHIAKIVDNIFSGRIHPFFINYFSANSSPGTVSSVSGNRSLDSKRFSQFALSVAKDVSKPERTSFRALEPISEGRPLASLISQPNSQALLSAISSTDLLKATVAPFGNRGKTN